MRNSLRAMNFRVSPRPAGVPEPTEPSPPRKANRPTRAGSHRGAPSAIRGLLEIAGETLWVGLLVMVIGFLAWKFPQISSAVDEISGTNRRPAATADESTQARVRELETRITGYENKLVPIERSYAQLKQRHADLQKAYDALRSASVRQAFAKPPDAAPMAAP